MSIENPTRGLRRLQPIQKASRLISEDRVALMPEARVYLVLGDTASYRVIVDPGGIFCPCKANTMLCSHALAVMQVRQHEAVLGEVA